MGPYYGSTSPHSGTLAAVSEHSEGQLDGLTVLELGSLIAGPFCTRLLADMGARVIKVEPPGQGDPLRAWSMVTEHGSLWSLVQSRNKESVAVDLRRPEGQELARRLAARVDVLVENFRPGRLESWGLDPAELRRLNPALVVVRISGFGQTGPYRDRPGYGSTGEALGGLRFITGFADRPPLKVGISLGDTVAALYAVSGALAALRRRDRTGRGEVVDVALHEAVFSLLESILPEYGSTGEVRQRRGNALLGSAPSNVYPTADGGYVTIGANGDSIFRRFCAAIGRPELANDPRFVDNQSRRANVAELDALIQRWTLDRTLQEVWELLNHADVPASPVYSIADIAADEQYRARDMILELDGPDGLGKLLVPGIVPRFQEAPGGVRWLGPPVGRHTEAVLRQELDLSAGEIRRLARDGVIGMEDATMVEGEPARG
ncbi:MAG: CoA transferase [Chloroflexi bacterium]|nr:MAG: CoA transferase [Chloroflexota bacterium]